MLEGMYADTALQFKEIRPYPVEPQEIAGVDVGTKGFYRYALHESDYPVLSVVDELQNEYGDKIPAGHYTLAITDEKDFLILIECKTPVAVIPVFKVEEDVSLPTKKELKIEKKKAKARAKTNEKRAKTGMTPDVEPIYKEASIEYVKEGNYYLIKYERGKIRAWGAVRSK